MIDLTNRIESFDTDDDFDSLIRGNTSMSPIDVRSHLQRHRINFTEGTKEGAPIFKLLSCIFCGESEGNPTIGFRDGVPWFKCHREKAGCSNKTYLDFIRRLESPSIVSAADLDTSFRSPPPDIIKGILRQGDVCNLIGGPKSKKSWMVALTAICIAHGVPWLGYETIKGKVLLVDNELPCYDLASRLRRVARAMGLSLDNVDVMSLRGKLPNIYRIRDSLKDETGKYSVIFCDALYKFLGGIDENSNGAMTAVYCVLDEIASQTGSAVSVIHHLSKGNQKAKSITDLGAGAGAQSRSADVHLALRDHEDDDAVVLEGVLRSQPPIKPVCLKWDYPLWKLALDKNPANYALTGNKKASPSIEAFLETIPSEPSRKTDTLAMSKNTLNTSRATIEVLYAEALKRGAITEKERTQLNQPIIIERVKK